jgi:hypothetical protein
MPRRNEVGKPLNGSGTGTGTNATIYYRPEAWGVFGTASDSTAPSNRPDEVLLHEMVHAARDMKGVSYLLPMAKGYENEEEFLAIVITNVYLSEKGQTALAANHISSDVLKDPNKLLDDPILGVRYTFWRFAKHEPNFFGALARVQADFNPFAQYKPELDNQGNTTPKKKN